MGSSSHSKARVFELDLALLHVVPCGLRLTPASRLACCWRPPCIDGAQYVGYLLLGSAYSANDAQKMVAIVAIGTAAQLDPVAATVPSQLAIAGLSAPASC